MSFPPPVHLPKQAAVLRLNAWGQAHKLTEQPPSKDSLAVIEWLAVEKHKRYARTAKDTFCNVYATDYCNTRGAYLPRVWWVDSAVVEFARGNECLAVYQKTVGELSANALCRWLVKWSHHYGWRRVSTLDEAQDAANRGAAVVICARRTQEAASGHISVIAPESPRLMAARGTDGRVLYPVQSQAGGRNEELALARPWWRGAEFAEYGFWVCELDAAPITKRETPRGMQAVREPIADLSSGAATPLRAGEGEHSPDSGKVEL